MTDAGEIEAAVATAVTRLGRVDVVVANAGITPRKTTTRVISTEEWERVIEVNLLGVWRTVRAGMEQVIANKGQFVLISSAYATANGLLNSSYATSKAAVESLGRSLRTELAPHGASASVAYFAFVKTGLIGEIFDNPLVDELRQELAPSFLTQPMEVSQVANALVEGIEKRSPRIIEPPAWQVPFWLRGKVAPLSDLRIERMPKVGQTVREIEAAEEGGRPEGANGTWVSIGRPEPDTTWPARSCWSPAAPRASAWRPAAWLTAAAHRSRWWTSTSTAQKRPPPGWARGRSASPPTSATGLRSRLRSTRPKSTSARSTWLSPTPASRPR